MKKQWNAPKLEVLDVSDTFGFGKTSLYCKLVWWDPKCKKPGSGGGGHNPGPSEPAS